MKFFGVLVCIFLSVLGLTSCAPQPEEDLEDSLDPDEVWMTEPVPDSTTPAMATPVPESTFDPVHPDWELRYRELYDLHLAQFKQPTAGQGVTLVLSSGREVKGIISDLTETEVVLDIGSGLVTYPAGSLAPQTAALLFASAYAETRAKAQGRREVQRWQRQQAAATPTPFPRGAPEGNIAARPGANGVDPVDLSTASGSVPKNEGPDGRVWQVDQYIRKNAALPHSLRIKAWGRVQPHESGYKVRVQYSLESAAGLGISREDMMFFMNRNGRVYRRAAVK